MKAARGETTDVADVRPLYMREADVQINWKAFREEDAWPR
jgi:hypothetical protein